MVEGCYYPKIQLIIMNPRSMVVWFFFISHLTAFQVGSDIDPDKLWQEYKQKYSKKYASKDEEAKRKSSFAVNLEWIMQTNVQMDQRNQSYRAKVTYFADLGSEEFKNLFIKPPTLSKVVSSFGLGNNIKPQIAVDWRRKEGIVTKVKNQILLGEEPCISGYAFAAIGAMEGQIGLRTNRTFDLSAQQLIDCTKPFGNMGCKSGNVENAYDYLVKNAINYEIDYPYIGKDQECHQDPEKTVLKLDKYITGQGEKWLEMAVGYLGPVAATIDPSSRYFQFYDKGLLDYPHWLKSPRHDLLVVGYGFTQHDYYWILKNSFGVDWGMEGYVYLKKGVKQSGIGQLFYLPALQRPE